MPKMQEPEPTKSMKVDNWTPRLGQSEESQCGTCMYYINARCRRHASQGQEGWPAVYPSDWCGDHKLSKEFMA